MWEDGNVESVKTLIEAADSTSSKETKRRTLLQAQSSAACIKDEYTRKNLLKLIEDKLADL